MIKKYADFINNHHASLVYQINTELDIQMEELRKEFLKQINYYLTTPELPAHYVEDHSYDPPYDHSGELVKEGQISTEITVKEFLEDEYNGDTRASYCSGCGFFHDTYSESLRSFTLEYGCNLMYRIIRENINKEFKVTISDEEFDELYDEMGCFDDIYDDTRINEFFFPEIVAQMCGIDNLKLSEVIELAKKEDDFIK